MISITQARQVKLLLKGQLQKVVGFAGIGISKINTDYCVQVYVNFPVAQYTGIIPSTVNGVKMVLVEIGVIKPLDE